MITIRLFLTFGHPFYFRDGRGLQDLPPNGVRLLSLQSCGNSGLFPFQTRMFLELSREFRLFILHFVSTLYYKSGTHVPYNLQVLGYSCLVFDCRGQVGQHTTMYCGMRISSLQTVCSHWRTICAIRKLLFSWFSLCFKWHRFVEKKFMLESEEMYHVGVKT